jgi:hypothetical protein
VWYAGLQVYATLTLVLRLCFRAHKIELTVGQERARELARCPQEEEGDEDVEPTEARAYTRRRP